MLKGRECDETGRNSLVVSRCEVCCYCGWKLAKYPHRVTQTHESLNALFSFCSRELDAPWHANSSCDLECIYTYENTILKCTYTVVSKSAKVAKIWLLEAGLPTQHLMPLFQTLTSWITYLKLFCLFRTDRTNLCCSCNLKRCKFLFGRFPTASQICLPSLECIQT